MKLPSSFDHPDYKSQDSSDLLFSTQRDWSTFATFNYTNERQVYPLGLKNWTKLFQANCYGDVRFPQCLEAPLYCLLSFLQNHLD